MFKKMLALVTGISICIGVLLPVNAFAETETIQDAAENPASVSVSDNDPDQSADPTVAPEPTEVPEITELITEVRAEFGSWSYPYDHTEKRSLYIVALSKPAHVTWDIYTSTDGVLFNSYEADFPAGENMIDWNGVDGNGEHPAGTVENPTRVFYRVVIKAESEDGMTDEKKAAFSFRFTHDFTSHKDYLEEHLELTETPGETTVTPEPTEIPEEITETHEPTAIPTPTPSTVPQATIAPTATEAAVTPAVTEMPAESDLPKTGDYRVPYSFYIILLAAAAAGFVFSIGRGKQN